MVGEPTSREIEAAKAQNDLDASAKRTKELLGDIVRINTLTEEVEALLRALTARTERRKEIAKQIADLVLEDNKLRKEAPKYLVRYNALAGKVNAIAGRDICPVFTNVETMLMKTGGLPSPAETL